MVQQLVPLVAVTAPFIFVILSVWFKSVETRKRDQLQAELYDKALEKGQPIPSDLFVMPSKKRNPLNSGIICIAIGVGISLALWLISILAGDPDIEKVFRVFATIGIVPFFVGIAFVIIHIISKKQTDCEKAQ